MDRLTQFKERLVKYLEIEAMSRYEEPVATELRNSIKPGYEISRDKFGSIIFHKPSKKANAPKVMIAAHMDEVGYIVRSIDKTGQLLLSPIGGIWANTVIGTKAKLVVTETKEEYLGVFGHTSIHIMQSEKVSKAVTNDELYADFGFRNEEEAKAAKVQPGDRVYMSGETILFKNPDLVGGKAMDNRAGVTVLEFIANNLADKELDIDLYLVGTVQEEVGTRGAKTSVSIIKPDVAIALDTTSSHDTIGTISGTTALFKGAALRYKDGGTLMDPKLVAFFEEVAKKHDIKAYRFVAMGGGTDAHELQFAPGGASVLTISLPQRYLHSPIGVCAISDLLAAGDLLTEFCVEFNQEAYNNIKYK
ncbi:M42 family metallopeptidase [Mycoplasma hafezii]|uniref:M42 family metallopeptidase n=1 Tax=Mycoplasma hafezii TaxID=525886 RepID=UPI003CF4DBA7